MVSLQEIWKRHKFYSNSSVQGGDDKRGIALSGVGFEPTPTSVDYDLNAAP